PAGHPAKLPIRAGEAVFDFVILNSLEGTTNRLEHLVPVLGMDAIQESLERAAERTRSQAMDRLHVIRPADFPGVNVPIPGPDTAPFQSEAQFVPALPRRFLRPLALDRDSAQDQGGDGHNAHENLHQDQALMGGRGAERTVTTHGAPDRYTR